MTTALIHHSKPNAGAVTTASTVRSGIWRVPLVDVDDPAISRSSSSRDRPHSGLVPIGPEAVVQQTEAVTGIVRGMLRDRLNDWCIVATSRHRGERSWS